MKRARSWRVGDEAWSPEAPVPVRIVEDHHYALRHVHGGIRRHRVPASGLRMLHFDSHPDLLVAKIPASTYSDATALYDALDSCEDGIATWIMPLAYGSHLSEVVWVHSPHCKQIECGRHHLRIGPRGGDDDPLGVDSGLRYFAQGLCASKLASDKRSAPLTVWSQSLDASGAEASQVAALARDWGRSLMVDICLDYFSVRNPFADELDSAVGPRTREQLAAPFQAAVEADQARYGAFLRACERTLRALPDGAAAADQVEAALGPFCGRAATALGEARAVDWPAFVDAVRAVGVEKTLAYGPVLDQPHHCSSEEEVEGMLQGVERVLAQCPRPCLVTIARSADDGFTPPELADELEGRVIALLRRVYGCLHLARDEEDVDAAHPSLWHRPRRRGGAASARAAGRILFSLASTGTGARKWRIATSLLPCSGIEEGLCRSHLFQWLPV